MPPAVAAILTIEPDRWFAPADGVTRINFTITLRNGSGNPIPGETVHLETTRGDLTEGGKTDVQGQTSGFLTSSDAGDAIVTAKLDAKTACEVARSITTDVTFAPYQSGDLLPNASAPYLDNDIEVDPEPIVRGVPTHIRVTIDNPNNFAIKVNGTFGFVQSGIGLAFAPLGSVQDKVIPANGQQVIETQFTPVVSGHYCVEFDYNWQAAAGASAAGVNFGSGRGQRNLDVSGGPLGSPSEKDALNRADKAFSAVSKIPSGPTQVQKALLGQWWQWVKNSASKISKSLGGDPPRQDYTVIAQPVKPNIPSVQPGQGVSQQRADALNAVNAALEDVVGYGNAATITLDRYGGAASADDLEWSSLQANALVYYKKQWGQALITYADKLDAYLHVLQTEGVMTIPITVQEFQSYQDRLRTSGFTSQEIADAKLVGLTDDDINEIKAEELAVDPQTASGDLMQRMAQESTTARDLGNVLINPPNFPSLQIRGGATAAAEPNNLARVFDTVATIQVGNPQNQKTTIQLRSRPINLPSDWTVTLSPQSVTLAPGEHVTVTVGIHAGSPTVQGATPTVAVEGYAGNTLLGGVALRVIVPQVKAFNIKPTIYLPGILR